MMGVKEEKPRLKGPKSITNTVKEYKGLRSQVYNNANSSQKILKRKRLVEAEREGSTSDEENVALAERAQLKPGPKRSKVVAKKRKSQMERKSKPKISDSDNEDSGSTKKVLEGRARRDKSHKESLPSVNDDQISGQEDSYVEKKKKDEQPTAKRSPLKPLPKSKQVKSAGGSTGRPKIAGDIHSDKRFIELLIRTVSEGHSRLLDRSVNFGKMVMEMASTLNETCKKYVAEMKISRRQHAEELQRVVKMLYGGSPSALVERPRGRPENSNSSGKSNGTGKTETSDELASSTQVTSLKAEKRVHELTKI